MDQLFGHLLELFHISQNQGVLAEQIDDAGDAAAGAMNCRNSLVGEDAP